MNPDNEINSENSNGAVISDAASNSDYYELPQPDEISIREKEDAMGAYLMMFAAIAAGLPLPVINLVASIIYYFINKSKSKFVHFHALQALLSSLIVSCVNAAAVFWTVRIFLFHRLEYNDAFKGFILTVVIINVAYIIYNLIAAFQARKGRIFYMFVFGKIAYERIYKVKSNVHVEPIRNMPPK